MPSTVSGASTTTFCDHFPFQAAETAGTARSTRCARSFSRARCAPPPSTRLYRPRTSFTGPWSHSWRVPLRPAAAPSVSEEISQRPSRSVRVRYWTACTGAVSKPLRR
ncbi:hypothetical protein NCG97_27615 [Streptomyces lydicamycinicus]|uniref:hypothetical protein n=1 Tax=Streptomyces lydicamycinicus TaxID=1546107 RepID=UPI002035E0C3|nr:hypothetical protein [Streptomyces lydicamycinicus]USA03543.1 hypothetical protein NCG97_27615 [Streptomyces lydicamycinicus]